MFDMLDQKCEILFVCQEYTHKYFDFEKVSHHVHTAPVNSSQVDVRC